METTNHEPRTTNNKTLACVTTAKGTGAISCIQVAGPSSGEIIKKIFTPTGRGETDFRIGDIFIGNIVDGLQVIDHVVVGCEGPDNFAINCHGNPIIVEMIMKLLKRHGSQPAGIHEMLAEQLTSDDKLNTIAIEAKLSQLDAVTLEGVKIIANQPRSGLGKIAGQWLADIDSLTLQDLWLHCKQIITDSETASLIINGCKVVIAGPPNSGKSTLLNCLSGRDKAIVADTAGTTRDWVTGKCRTDRLLMELIDTAGLDEKLRDQTKIDKEAQKKAVELLDRCDLVLFVLDGSREIDNEELKIERGFLKGKRVLVVLNKLDLGQKADQSQLGLDFTHGVSISAKSGDRIEILLKRIREVLGVEDFVLSTPVCITQRQLKLLKLISHAWTKTKARTLIKKLLSDKKAVVDKAFLSF